MIVAHLDGGLGNQMFQYAFGLQVARTHGTQLFLDLSSYQAKPAHGYLLNRFAIQAVEATNSLVDRFPRKYLPVAHKQRALPDWLRWSSLRRVREKPFGFQSKYLATSDNSFLVGYWQSDKYFADTRSELIKHFQLVEKPSLRSQQVAAQMAACDSLAVHIRRGDYVSNSEAAKIYVNLPLSYYEHSIDDFARQRKKVEVFVFSNDHAWCREQLRTTLPIHFVDHNSPSQAHEDLWLLTQAAGCVIANSTFSWWGAYLNQRENNQVYAPQHWFQPGTLDGSNLLCKSWQLMDWQTDRMKRAA